MICVALWFIFPSSVFILSFCHSALWERNQGNCCLSGTDKNTKYSWSGHLIRGEHSGSMYNHWEWQILISYFILSYNWALKFSSFFPPEACFVREVCRADHYCCKPWFKRSLDIISGNQINSDTISQHWHEWLFWTCITVSRILLELVLLETSYFASNYTRFICLRLPWKTASLNILAICCWNLDSLILI